MATRHDGRLGLRLLRKRGTGRAVTRRPFVLNASWAGLAGGAAIADIGGARHTVHDGVDGQATHLQTQHPHAEPQPAQGGSIPMQLATYDAPDSSITVQQQPMLKAVSTYVPTEEDRWRVCVRRRRGSGRTTQARSITLHLALPPPPPPSPLPQQQQQQQISAGAAGRAAVCTPTPGLTEGAQTARQQAGGVQTQAAASPAPHFAVTPVEGASERLSPLLLTTARLARLPVATAAHASSPAAHQHGAPSPEAAASPLTASAQRIHADVGPRPPPHATQPGPSAARLLSAAGTAPVAAAAVDDAPGGHAASQPVGAGGPSTRDVGCARTPALPHAPSPQPLKPSPPLPPPPGFKHAATWVTPAAGRGTDVPGASTAGLPELPGPCMASAPVLGADGADDAVTPFSGGAAVGAWDDVDVAADECADGMCTSHDGSDVGGGGGGGGGGVALGVGEDALLPDAVAAHAPDGTERASAEAGSDNAGVGSRCVPEGPPEGDAAGSDGASPSPRAGKQGGRTSAAEGAPSVVMEAMEVENQVPGSPGQARTGLNPKPRSRTRKRGTALQEITRRKSLAHDGLEQVQDAQEGGVRRSTRGSQRPLQYWRNEHKEYGRNHASLPTVVRTVTRTPNPNWPRTSTAAANKRRARTKP